MSRTRFFSEAEAYPLLELAGLHPPRHALVDGFIPFAPGEAVVLKGLGEGLWHKSELGAVHFCAFDQPSILEKTAAIRARIEAAGHRWLGGLVCEKVTGPLPGSLPHEAFVSIVRGAGGWMVLCGFGGLSAEALAELAPPLRWPPAFVSSRQAGEEFQAHLLGRIWLGRLRGTRPLTAPEKVASFFEQLWKLIALAENEGLTLLELNPIVLDQSGLPRPLDAVGRRAEPEPPRLPPPAGFLNHVRAPRRIALAGVSAQAEGTGRTILENLRRYRLPAGDLVLIKPGTELLFGLPCVPDVGALRTSPVDLLILALPARVAVQAVLYLLDQGGGASVVALVSGGIGDGADTGALGATVRARLHEAREAGRWTPAVLGPNFLGHWVQPSDLDSSFIPAGRLAPPPPAGGALTLLSQSGAFLLSRRSHQPALRFGLGLALGNQLDVSLADVLGALGAESTDGPIAAYVEGFGPGHLEPAATAIARLRARGRLVLLHRAGRTSEGQAAAASHTGAMAGDLVLERTLLERAGTRFTETIAEFDAALTWLGAYPRLEIGPVALLTNAGFESVRCGDLFGARLPAATWPEDRRADIAEMLRQHGLDGLVNPRLPLDLTPMADEAAFLAGASLVLEHAGVLVVGLVPFTRRLRTDAEGGAALAGALAGLAAKWGKPVAVAVDAGEAYAAYRAAFAAAGLPVFARLEDALLGLRVLA